MQDLASAFGLMFLAELGDKSMLLAVAFAARYRPLLATIALAGTQAPIPTWLGASAGMVAASGIAIAVTTVLGSRLPERSLHRAAGIAFLAFGVWFVIDAIRA